MRALPRASSLYPCRGTERLTDEDNRRVPLLDSRESGNDGKRTPSDVAVSHAKVSSRVKRL